MKWYRHKPTGWIYHQDPECPIYLLNTVPGCVKIPKSIAVFGNQQDWEEIIVVTIVNDKGEMIKKYKAVPA